MFAFACIKPMTFHFETSVFSSSVYCLSRAYLPTLAVFRIYSDDFCVMLVRLPFLFQALFLPRNLVMTQADRKHALFTRFMCNKLGSCYFVPVFTIVGLSAIYTFETDSFD